MASSVTHSKIVAISGIRIEISVCEIGFPVQAVIRKNRILNRMRKVRADRDPSFAIATAGDVFDGERTNW